METLEDAQYLNLLVNGCSKLAPYSLHVLAIDLVVGNAGDVYQATAVKTEGSHVLQQEKGIYGIYCCHQSL